MVQMVEKEVNRLEIAARAGWLYYIAGNTQDEIARKLGVSRQSAQRFVSLAVSEQLIKFRLDHPISRCMELAEGVKERYELAECKVVPSDPDSPTSIAGIAQAGAAEMERHLKQKKARIIALGTGRALKASVEQLPPMQCRQHRIVSLVGNMMSDGSATAYNVVVRMAERVDASHYPIPLPVFARSEKDRRNLQKQEPAANILALAGKADVTFVGIGNLGQEAPLLVDGFLTQRELKAAERAGAIGEIIGWVFDGEGNLIEGITNARVASAALRRSPPKPVVGIAAGVPKVAAIAGALRGKWVNSLITNEITAEHLLGYRR